MNMVDDPSKLNGYAIDLGGTKIAAALIDAGCLVERSQVATDRSAGLDAQIDAIEALLKTMGYEVGDTLGVAVTGRISRDGYWGAVNAGTLSAIGQVPLGNALRERFGPNRAVNDAAAAAYAESRFGSGKGSENFLYITVSTGVGGGVVLSGRLLESANGLAGHIGFVSSAERGAGPCGSGRANTVESVAGGRSLAAQAAALGYPEMDAKAIFEALGRHEEWAEQIIERSATAVACLISDLTAVLGLDCVAIGGSIGLAPSYFERVKRHLRREPALFKPDLRIAELEHDSALYGALALAIAEQDAGK